MSENNSLSEVSDEELLGASDGEISLTGESGSDSEEFDDVDNSINSNSGSEISITDTDNDEEQAKNPFDEDDDPWILPNDGDIPSGLSGLQQHVELSDSDESGEENINDDDEYKKIEKANKNQDLLDFHPEITQINYKELQTLCKITRNKKGAIIDPLHKTIPILTRYEKAKILGLRAKQINNGSNIFVEANKNIIDGHLLAHMELEQKKLPFIVRRPLPNGGSEYWRLSDLEIVD
jgi:DNA-directed RNA polymerase subunit K/omega